MDRSRIMYNMTVKEVREGLKEMKTVVVPVGVVEQHGYHLPLSTDIFNAQEIAVRASALSGCFVAPTMHYSFSGGTLPGTINVSPQVVSLVLMDIFRSLVAQGFKNIVVLLGHGGSENIVAVKDAATNFQRLDPSLEDICITMVPFWEMSKSYMKSFEEGDYHAGKYETSMMLFWQPQLVQMDHVAVDSKELLERMRTDPDAYAGQHKAIDSVYVVPKLVQNPEIEVGVMGDPFSPSVELGKAIAEECSSGLAALVKQLEERF